MRRKTYTLRIKSVEDFSRFVPAHAIEKIDIQLENLLYNFPSIERN
jgi:hypothetical protein